MRSRIITALLTCACAGIARADFNPVALTPGSYTYDIVVESNTPPALPYCITATTGSGTSEGDNTYYEQGFYARPGQPGYNDGIPLHNTIFTNINNSNVTFLMPPTVLTNNDLQVDSTTTGTGAFLFNSPTTATNLAILSGGSGTVAISYVVTHTDNSTDTGTINCSDWFTPNGAQVAWGANGRVSAGGGFDTRSTSTNNTTYPYLYSYYITVSGAQPITSISFTYVSGGHEGNFYGVSGKAVGASVWTPIPVGGFNQMTTVPTAFPVTATMDNGTNTSNSGAMNTFYEEGFDAAAPTTGLPPSGSTFTSQAQSTHHYMMGIYTSNNATLIDANHLVANITPATPAPFSSFAFLTAGGNVGGSSVMTNICVLQHADGVQETNLFFGYDWFNGSLPVAYNCNGRVQMENRTLNNVNNTYPRLFESYFVLNDVGSPVTNIVLKYKTAPSASSTTYVLAVSASAGGVPPVIAAGALPATQTLFLTQSASFSVQESGTPPITNFWEVESNGVYVPLPNGVDFNGSTVSGNGSATLTISGITLDDGTNYIDVVANAFGSVTSAPAALVIDTGTPVAPIIDSQIPTSSFGVLAGHVDTTTFSVTIDASSSTPLNYQWYSGSTPIPGANNATYPNVDTNAVTLSCVITNFGGSVTSAPVTISFFSKPTPSSYEAAVLAYSPVAYWPLTETRGNIAFDYASTNDGTYEGNFTLGNTGLPVTAGVGANVSAGFDGSTAYVDVPVGKLNITGPITLIQWVLSQSTGFETTFGHSDQSYRLDDASGQAHFADSGPDVVDTTSLNDGNWHMLVGVFDGTDEHLYVDGQVTGGSPNSTPSGSGDDVWIGGAPDYPGARNFAGYSAQVAIIASALSPAQVASLYNSVGVPPSVTVTPASPSVYAGGNVTLSAQTSGSTATKIQWYYIDNSNNSNNIAGATNLNYTIVNAQLAQNGYQYGITIGNAYGSATAAVTLSVQNGPAYLGGDISPLTGEAYVGAPVTYTVGAAGSAPFHYQWFVDGTAVAGATSASFTFPAECGMHSIQVSFTNSQSGGVPITSSLAELQGDASPTNITFDTDGTGWQINGAIASITGNVLELTDGNGGEASSAFYMTPQYVGTFTASFTYTPDGGADGTCFIVQNNTEGADALGGGGGELAYYPITNSIALEFNLYNGAGIAQGTNGNTSSAGNGNGYTQPVPVYVASDPINVVINWANGVMGLNLTDTVTGSTFSTNYVYGPLTGFLAGSNLGYIGFSGADGGVTSIQTISNFQFSSTIPPVSLTATPATNGAIVISWPSTDPNYHLQTTTSLTSPSWVAGPAPVLSNGVSSVTVSATGGAQAFYQLVRTVTCN